MHPNLGKPAKKTALSGLETSLTHLRPTILMFILGVDKQCFTYISYFIRYNFYLQ